MTWIGQKRIKDFMVLLNDFSFLKINGFEKPKCWKDVDKPGPSAVIHDSGQGNNVQGGSADEFATYLLKPEV